MPYAKFILLSSEPSDSKLETREFGLDSVISFPPRNKLIFLVKTIKKVDIIVDISGIMFSDFFGRSFLEKIFEGAHLLVGKALRKIVIKYTCDMGPFNNLKNRIIAKLCLNRIDLIFARSKVTMNYLRQIGVTTPIFVIPDTAFILKPYMYKKEEIISCEKIGKQLVGISVSHTIMRYKKYEKIDFLIKEKYIKVISELIHYLTKNVNAYVLLIPNELNFKHYNDLSVAREIFDSLTNKKDVLLLEKEYNAKHLKGIIRLCDLFIGSRYHSIVAALSSCVPTIAIGWHHKYQEVMKSMNLENFVFDINNLDFTKLREKIEFLLENIDGIKKMMVSKYPLLVKDVLKGGKILEEVIQKKIYQSLK